jgi:uncharacterized paraquat-inducible protein A
MFCTKCGIDLPDDSQFCRKCGQAQSVSSTAGAAAAVAPAKIKPDTQTASAKSQSRLGGLVAALIVLLLVVGFLLRMNLGVKGTNQVIATVVHAPITLTDEVQNLPAHSFKTIGFNLPYTGTLNVSLQVVRGNPVDVFLVRSDQLDAVNRQDWRNVSAYGTFSATKTETYQRDGRLEQGAYYLVLRDLTLGILSARASDVSLKVQLNP